MLDILQEEAIQVFQRTLPAHINCSTATSVFQTILAGDNYCANTSMFSLCDELCCPLRVVDTNEKLHLYSNNNIQISKCRWPLKKRQNHLYFG